MKEVTPKTKKNLFLAFRILIALVLLAYLINFIEPETLFQSLKSANLALLITGCLFVIPVYLLQFDKWKIFCRQILPADKTKQVFHSLLAGISAGLITPMRLGEHFGRIFVLNGSKKSDVLVLSVADKFLPHLFYPVFGIAAYYIYLSDKFPLIVDWLFFAGVFLMISSVMLIFKNQTLRNYLKRFKIINTLWQSVSLLKTMQFKNILRVYFDSLILYVINIAQYAILIWAFTGEAKFIDYFFGAAFIFFFKSLLPVISVGDLGVREISAVYFLAYFAVGEADAFNASVLLALINLFIPAGIGLLLINPKSE